MKQVIVALLIVLAVPFDASAQEGECMAEFPLVKGTGEFTALKLFNFGSHFELQADTPAQAPLDSFAAKLDGAPAELNFSMGLDDLLVVMSTHQSDLQVSPDFLGKLAKGNRFTVTANAAGKAASGEFSLKGSASAIKRLQAGCK